ncbi:MAG: hypothetical protein ACYCV7_15705 [Acidimicrobiales bacterium]
MAEQPDGHGSFRPDPDPEWDPDIRRVALVLDLDVSVIAVQVDTWAKYQLDELVKSLHSLGVMATPVHIEIDGRPRLV